MMTNRNGSLVSIATTRRLEGVHAADLEQLTAERASVDDLGVYADDLEDLADELNNLGTTR